MKHHPLSVVMITLNEEKNIARAVKSVDWADEICVADTGSTDNTVSIAKNLGAHVGLIEFSGFGRAKQKAGAMASHEWILSLDADEVVTHELKNNILKFLENPGESAGAEFGRATNFCGNWILHSGWYPEYVFRLFNKNKAWFNDKPLHESIKHSGKIKRINGLLLHFSYPDIGEYKLKTKSYARLWADKRRDLPFASKLVFMFIKPLIAFIRKFVVQFGFADGLPGLWIAAFSAYGQFLKHYYALKAKKTD